MNKKLIKYLEKYGIVYKVHKHPAVFTVEEHDKLIGKTPHMLHTKNLFLRDKKNRFYLVSMYARKRLDMKKLGRHLGVKKLTFGSPEELKKHLNLLPGHVSIFGAIYIKGKRVKLVIDKEVWEADIVGFHPNVNTATLEIRQRDLKKFYESLKCEKEVVEL